MPRNDASTKKQLAAAFALAERGDFAGRDAIIDSLVNKDREVRIKGAYHAGRVGFPAAIQTLSRMATSDPESDNRNEAIYALVGIGRPAVVPALIRAVDDDDAARRDDARTALYSLLGAGIDDLLADEDGGGKRDRSEARRLRKWWREHSGEFDKDLVYSMGEPASPGRFIQQLKARTTRSPDALFNALQNWTGQDFGQAPLPKVIKKWEKWWAENQTKYEAGRRYFHGHLVP